MKDDYFYQTDNIPPIDVEQLRESIREPSYVMWKGGLSDG